MNAQFPTMLQSEERDGAVLAAPLHKKMAQCPDLAEGHEVLMRSKRSLSAWRLMEKEGAGEGRGAASAALPRPPGDGR